MSLELPLGNHGVDDERFAAEALSRTQALDEQTVAAKRLQERALLRGNHPCPGKRLLHHRIEAIVDRNATLENLSGAALAFVQTGLGEDGITRLQHFLDTHL